MTNFLENTAYFFKNKTYSLKLLLKNYLKFQGGLQAPIHTENQYPDWYATDNLFPSPSKMDQAHQPIVKLAVATLSGGGGNILDLGCGNGALLQKIYQANPKIVPFGIEFEPKRVEHARLLLPEFAANFISGDIFKEDPLWKADRRYALAILSPKRFLEAGPERSAQLKKCLKHHCDRLLVYAYGKSLTRYGNLAGLAQKTGLVLLASDPDVKASLAEIS